MGGRGSTVNADTTSNYAQSDVGSGIGITGVALITSNLTATGSTSLSNYNLPATDNSAGNITPATLSVTASNASKVYGTTPTLTGFTTAADKVYDTTTAAVITGRALAGILGTDVVTYTGGTATFDNPAVGTGKTMTGIFVDSTSGDATIPVIQNQKSLR